MPNSNVIPGQEDLIKHVISSDFEITKILDIGLGNGLASKLFDEFGYEVTATGFDIKDYKNDQFDFPESIKLHENVDVTNMHIFKDEQFDAVWISHVLEHVLNTGLALKEIKRVLKPGGYLFVSVPPFKNTVVGGHIHTGWNVGNLMYLLASQGFDLYEEGAFIQHGYNVFGICKRFKEEEHVNLKYASGDIEKLTLLNRFPKGFDGKQGFQGKVKSVNWDWKISLSNFKEILNVAFFIPWITKGKGGTEHVGSQMANMMAERGHKVTIFTFENNEEASSKWELKSGVELVKIPENVDVKAEGIILLKLATLRPDLIVGLHMNRTFFKYVYFAKRLSIPVLLSEHIDPRMPRRIGNFTENERRVIFSQAEGIHLLTKGFCKTLPENIKNNIFVVPNTVREAYKLATPGLNEKVCIVAVARLVDRKNISLLIKAFSHVDFKDRALLRIVGAGPQQKMLTNLVNKLNLAQSVEFLGHMEDPYPIYESSDLFVIPSLYEGLPMTVLEAMAHGLPIIGFAACAGVNEQVIDGVNGYLLKDISEIELGKSIDCLIKDKVKLKEFGINSLQRYKKEYANTPVFEQWENMFVKTANKSVKKVNLSQQQYLDAKFLEMMSAGCQEAEKHRIEIPQELEI
ncbi:glycosyltransferase [Neptunomonas phycophila]|uniref:Glycosyltransferase n=1 Tax=Neptunomonas phycophila TaxID=1572645 RepID=A0ABT9ES16_9GAMM|nr:glycosyltransferase [Neptunomonas phycophila]MDP2521863.1 glycosyltransferase [Neptunomonas phycophila]